ncbi:MAG: diacylglycerol kinase family protein [Saprospiraceae bacterium]
MKQSINFIVNPFSGTTSKSNIAQLIDQNLDLDKYDYDILYTEYAGHAIALSQKCIDQNTDIIVAIGGDGSVNEVAQPIIGTETIFGIVPAGSGNGFARHLGISTNLKKGIRALNDSRIVRVDTCTVNNKAFVNVSGIGFDARIAYLTKKNSKRGFFPYLKTSIKQSRKFSPTILQIHIDDMVFDGDYTAVIIANASMYGYNFTIAPEATITDGVMDVVLIKKTAIYKYFFSSYRFLNRSLHKSNLTETYQAKKIKIVVKENDYYHIDGEGFKLSEPLVYSILPKSLNVLIPNATKPPWNI